MALSKPSFETDGLKFKELIFEVAIIGSQTQGSIKTFCPDNQDILVYHEDDTRTVTAVDSEIGFVLTDLDNDAPPATLGFLLQVGDASELIGVALITNSIKSVAMSAPATALGTVTFKGSAAAAGAVTKNGTSLDPTGVTATLHNIAFIADFTSLNIDEDNATVVNNLFALKVTYRKRQPV